MTGFLQWFAMNGYAGYIWPAYGMVVFVLVVNVLSIKKQSVRTRHCLRQWFKQS